MKTSTAVLSTIIDARVKRAVSYFCRQRGLKLRYVVEEALVERLEDEIDLAAYHRRRSEEMVSLDDVLSQREKSKS